MLADIGLFHFHRAAEMTPIPNLFPAGLTTLLLSSHDVSLPVKYDKNMGIQSKVFNRDRMKAFYYTYTKPTWECFNLP
jgi:hypothetical protein